jgi:Spherulation-specific family 4
VRTGLSGRTRIAVPAYFHPSWAPADWAWLCRSRPRPPADVVVINPDSGIGRRADTGYGAVVKRLREVGVTVAGYVDTAYGRRLAEHVIDEALAYRSVYELDAIFLDQVSADRSGLTYYQHLSTRLAAAHMHLILNPGTAPVPEYLDLADVVVTFEGAWETYRALSPTPALRGARAATWHLVHSTPPEQQEQVLQRVYRHRADLVYITDAMMPNPWDRLPTRWSSLLEPRLGSGGP